MNLILHACMLQKGAIPRRLNPRKFIPSKYTRYTVVILAIGTTFIDGAQYNSSMYRLKEVGANN